MRKSEQAKTNYLIVTQHRRNEEGKITNINGIIITSSGQEFDTHFDVENKTVNVDRIGEKSLNTLHEHKPLAILLANLEVKTQTNTPFTFTRETETEQEIVNAVEKFTEAAKEALQEKPTDKHNGLYLYTNNPLQR